MNVSEQIRALASEGLSTGEIARRLGIRYQHAYNVLNNSTGRQTAREIVVPTVGQIVPVVAAVKPPLPAEILTSAGFKSAGQWILNDSGELTLNGAVPRSLGVYAFVKNGIAQYVGVATIGLAKRLYFYMRPGPTQRTSQRLNEILKSELVTVSGIDVLTASPPDLEWNGLPVHGSAGLELGLIKKYSLPWNVRSAS